jgi:hypothetical protein
MHRKALRDAVMAGMAGHARFAAMTAIRAWTQGIDDAALPAYGVLTPQESARRAAKDLLARTVQLVVVLKRAGAATIEDDLDADAEAIEAVVGAAVFPTALDYTLTDTQMPLSGEGGARAGSIVLRFDVTVHSNLTFDDD